MSDKTETTQSETLSSEDRARPTSGSIERGRGEGPYLLKVTLKFGGEHNLAFADYATAKREHDAMVPKLAERFSNDPEKRTHKVSSACGEATFVMDEIAAVRVIDDGTFMDMVGLADQKHNTMFGERLAVAIALALKAAT
jgi:hypothetical protein